MPKVIFRPNPVPPPFPPPTPSYDTTSTIKLRPHHFLSGDNVDFELPYIIPIFFEFTILLQ